MTSNEREIARGIMELGMDVASWKAKYEAECRITTLQQQTIDSLRAAIDNMQTRDAPK